MLARPSDALFHPPHDRYLDHSSIREAHPNRCEEPPGMLRENDLQADGAVVAQRVITLFLKTGGDLNALDRYISRQRKARRQCTT